MTPSTIPLAEAAAIIGIHKRTAYQLARDHGYLVPEVPVFRVASLWKVSRPQLERFLQGQAVAS